MGPRAAAGRGPRAAPPPGGGPRPGVRAGSGGHGTPGPGARRPSRSGRARTAGTSPGACAACAASATRTHAGGPRPVGARPAHPALHAELRREVRHLVGSAAARLADPLLEPDHVGRGLGDHVADPVEVQAAVQPDAPVDVVAHDRDRDHAASRERMKCAYSSVGWAIGDASVTVGGWMTNVCSSSYDGPPCAPTSGTNDTLPSGAPIP